MPVSRDAGEVDITGAMLPGFVACTINNFRDVWRIVLRKLPIISKNAAARDDGAVVTVSDNRISGSLLKSRVPVRRQC